jgi:hypothetical protein
MGVAAGEPTTRPARKSGRDDSIWFIVAMKLSQPFRTVSRTATVAGTYRRLSCF